MSRSNYHLTYSDSRKLWEVRAQGGELMNFGTIKSALLEDAVRWCKTALDAGYHSELHIHGKDGRVQDRKTFGADPKRRKG